MNRLYDYAEKTSNTISTILIGMGLGAVVFLAFVLYDSGAIQ